MGARGVIAAALAGVAAALAGCPNKHEPVVPAPPPAPRTLGERVVADFERAVRTSKAAYTELFDFAAVGEMEVLLHRYDINGRLPDLPDRLRAIFEAEDGTPYTPERERRNVRRFYKPLAKRTVGAGDCTAGPPRSDYGRQLGSYPPLPADTPPAYETLRAHANAWLRQGGVIAIRCAGGEGGLALVYTARPNERGYDLITIYDD